RVRGVGSIAGTIALTSAGAALLFRFVRRRPPSRPHRVRNGAFRADAELVLGLYERLDAAMRSIGRARPPGVPPLRHAEALVASGDLLGPEIRDLTRAYLSVRFGGAALSEHERLAFEQRVRALGQAGVPRISQVRK